MFWTGTNWQEYCLYKEVSTDAVFKDADQLITMFAYVEIHTTVDCADTPMVITKIMKPPTKEIQS